MPNYLIVILVIIVCFLLGWFIVSKVLSKKKFETKQTKLPIDVEDVIEAVGGKDNIKETIASGSKITFFLKNDELLNKDHLTKLGASGIVQTNSKLTVIIGKYSTQISQIINDKL